MMKKAKNLILALCCALLVGLMVGSMAPAIAYAEPTPTEGGTTSDLVNTGVSALGDVQEGIVKIAMAVFAISVIISLICLFVTHDPKKITSILWRLVLFLLIMVLFLRLLRTSQTNLASN